ncbi:hypothetical protein [Algoriphagus resistens]|uniref:hypothetical protein n=1 Tax=Algoriphagus resistens TaxID=1750590 RepID=UPI000716ADDE|nr:hypothetical protein [Algoriphagus resistens]
MKLLSLISLLLVSISFIACDKDEDELPKQLSGIWEERFYVDSVGYWVVNTLEFKSDNEYQFRTTVREVEAGPDLGYRFYYDDSYTWDGETFSYSPDLASWIDHREENFYVPKEELNAGIIDYVRMPTASLVFEANNTKMIFQEICPEDILPCEDPFEVKEYTRAD